MDTTELLSRLTYERRESMLTPSQSAPLPELSFLEIISGKGHLHVIYNIRSGNHDLPLPQHSAARSLTLLVVKDCIIDLGSYVGINIFINNDAKSYTSKILLPRCEIKTLMVVHSVKLIAQKETRIRNLILTHYTYASIFPCADRIVQYSPFAIKYDNTDPITTGQWSSIPVQINCDETNVEMQIHNKAVPVSESARFNLRMQQSHFDILSDIPALYFINTYSSETVVTLHSDISVYIHQIYVDSGIKIHLSGNITASYLFYQDKKCYSQSDGRIRCSCQVIGSHDDFRFPTIEPDQMNLRKSPAYKICSQIIKRIMT